MKNGPKQRVISDRMESLNRIKSRKKDRLILDHSDDIKILTERQKLGWFK